ncbi:MAG TPA: hypothetical protein DCP40_08745 [Stenotrophomonas sp.]|nr:hypothetical protein [Stenotrophomonas sp.]
MPIEFTPQARTAFDAFNGITISFPRIVASDLPDGSEATEYQYTFRQGERILAAMSVLGTEERTGEGEHWGWKHTLDLSSTHTLALIARLEADLGSTDDPMEFLRAIAKGLLAVFVNQTDNFREVRYVVITRAGALRQVGIDVSEGAALVPDGQIILAELTIPAHVF